MLVGVIAAGTNEASFDMTGDGLVDLADRDAWLTVAGAANNASGGAYLLGDADLDGFVDTSDFNIWNNNKFTNVAEWCQGDFNADGVVDTSDFNIWNNNKFQSSGRTTVRRCDTSHSDSASVANEVGIEFDAEPASESRVPQLVAASPNVSTETSLRSEADETGSDNHSEWIDRIFASLEW